MTLPGRPVTEDGELQGGGFEAGKLQPGVEGGALAAMRRQRLGVAALEIGAHGGALRAAFDADDPPRLAVADRWSELREIQQLLDQVRRRRIGAEAPDIAAPRKQGGQLAPKSGIEGGRLAIHEEFPPRGRSPASGQPRSPGRSIHLTSGASGNVQARPSTT